jgi:hypothetical protein
MLSRLEAKITNILGLFREMDSFSLIVGDIFVGMGQAFTNSRGFHSGTRNPSSGSNHPVNKQRKHSWRVLLCALM